MKRSDCDYGSKQSSQSQTGKSYITDADVIYSFVHNMPDFMRAAELLVTKAGSGTINEALNGRLPMIFCSHLPGQETGNIPCVVSEGAGVWAPNPHPIVGAVKRWIEHPDEHKQAVEACRHMARSDAARRVAQSLAEIVNRGR